MAELTPMMKQYLEIKRDNPDSILFFRLGDFYEMFADDAKLASRELDLTLTSRDHGKHEGGSGRPFLPGDVEVFLGVAPYVLTFFGKLLPCLGEQGCARPCLPPLPHGLAAYEKGSSQKAHEGDKDNAAQ